MLSLWFSRQEEKEEPGAEKSGWSRSYFRARTKFLICLGLLSSGGWAGLQREAAWWWIQRYLRQHPQAALSSTRRRSPLAAAVALRTARKDTAEIIKRFHRELSKPYELFLLLLLLPVPIISGKRGYILISEHHIQRLGSFEWQSRCAGFMVGSLSPAVGRSFSLFLLLLIFKIITLEKSSLLNRTESYSLYGSGKKRKTFHGGKNL